MGEMKSAVDRFTGLAGVYAACRPGYPPAAIQHIVEVAALSAGDAVADVGCGTGISTRQLAAAGLRVFGIEPNDDMRAQAEASAITGPHPPVYLRGAAEATGLADGSVKAVVAAQAFHWFKPDAALREFARILVTSGAVALMWNEVDRADDLGGRYVETIARHSPEPGIARQVLSETALALNSHPRFHHSLVGVFPHSQTLDWDGLIGRARSASYAPKNPVQFLKMESALLELFGQHEHAGRIALPYRCSVFTAQSRE